MNTARLTLITAAFALVTSALFADPLTCNLTGYKALPGLTAAVSDNTLAITWDGDKNREVRLRLTINNGTPTIRVQVKEDGVSMDQVVLSAGNYLNMSPGALKNDTTILSR